MVAAVEAQLHFFLGYLRNIRRTIILEQIQGRGAVLRQSHGTGLDVQTVNAGCAGNLAQQVAVSEVAGAALQINSGVITVAILNSSSQCSLSV